MPKPWWDWPISVPFSMGWVADGFLFMGGQIAAKPGPLRDPAQDIIGVGDIAAQTRATFEYLTRVLQEAGCSWSDVVKLTTFFDPGPDGDERAAFEAMARVQADFLSEPGPAWTAVRTPMASEGLMIEVDGIAAVGEHVRRSIPVRKDRDLGLPRSAAWIVDDLVFLGAQTALGPPPDLAGDLAVQTRRVFEALSETLAEAESTWADVVKLNTFYDDSRGDQRFVEAWKNMTEIRLEYMADPGPAGTGIRTGLPYPELLIEVDLIAARNALEDRERIMPKPWWDWPMKTPFSQAWRVGNIVFVGGQVAFDAEGEVIGRDDIRTQTRAVFEYITRALADVGADWSNVVKLNTYYDFQGEGDELVEYWKGMTEARLEFLPDPGPASTAIRAGLGAEGLMIESEAIAVL
jgi:enamine deaminase RidA (YjgF/YER057c/UK114 family)